LNERLAMETNENRKPVFSAVETRTANRNSKCIHYTKMRVRISSVIRNIAVMIVFLLIPVSTPNVGLETVIVTPSINCIIGL